MGVDATATLNVHTIAIRVPIKQLTRDGSAPTDPMRRKAVLGIWGAASRRKTRVIDQANDERAEVGPWVQVSRLGNPLFNEVVVPLGEKDKWNASHPAEDKEFAKYVEHPELAKLLPVLYPGVFPNLAALKAKRADLVAILLTGLPKGIVPGFQNYTGTVLADMLRLNVAIPPDDVEPEPARAGRRRPRRVPERAAGVRRRRQHRAPARSPGSRIPLVDPSYTPDAAAAQLTAGPDPGPDRYQSTFPYLGTPHDGFSTPSS